MYIKEPLKATRSPRYRVAPQKLLAIHWVRYPLFEETSNN